MKWHSHESSYQTARRVWMRPPDRVEEFYRRSLDIIRTDLSDIATNEWKHQLAVEQAWERNHRPYYNVWPSVAKALIRISLDISCESTASAIEHMPRAVNLRLAEGHELTIGPHHLRSALVGRINLVEPFAGRHGIAVFAQAGETHSELGKEIPVYWSARINSDNRTFEENLIEIGFGADGSEVMDKNECNVVKAAIRMYLSIALMRGDPDLVDSIVLPADRDRYLDTGDRSLVERARGRGIVGWDVGARVEVSPHYRRPHFGVRWCGAGKAVPKVVPIKGAVIHRRKLTEVPTGYLSSLS